ncbi:hypothetical protein [Pedobacter chitinilyticus]|uniref:Uncharacterized protein n=1 Tax=Pedobacter chitinilyticus TaxID=2233776 RepID=A0A443YU39_9SPHI|nr:hypothetical protein [Pedobacter chitinilyticus]RWU07378.1 hypothetical protein DPV69_10310 [Pedobacter chitinilyticus]
MKHLMTLLSFLCLTVLGLEGCKKGKVSTELPKCNLTGKQIIAVENKTATLIYSNNITGVTIEGRGGFYLINTNVEGISLPLKVCNFPKDKFRAIAIGDHFKVGFSGKIELLPETADAFSLNIELKSINEIGSK